MHRAPLALLGLLFAPDALAAGYYFPDSGIVAVGRGGAFVAGADNQYAQYYNPAGLIRIDAPTLNVGWSGVGQQIAFTRIDEDGTTHETVENQAPLFSVPEIGFAAPLRDDLVLAVGFYSPYAPSYQYDPDGPQRYSVIDTFIAQGWAGPSAAWQPVPQLTLGLGLNWNFAWVEEQLKVTTRGDDDPAGDIAVDLEARDMLNFGFNLGLLVEPVEQLSIGVGFVPGSRYRGKGSARLDFTGNSLLELGAIDQAEWEDDEVTLEIRLPMVLRTGVAVRPVQGLEIEGAWVWERWSAMTDLVVDDIDITVTGAIEQEVDEQFIIPADFRDGMSFRLGGEYAINDVLDVRAGGFYELPAQRPQQVSVALMDTHKVQLGAGTTVKLLRDRLWLDASAATIRFRSLQVRDSEVTQINAFDPNKVETVGNGDYRASGFVVGVAARWRFLGKAARSEPAG